MKNKEVIFTDSVIHFKGDTRAVVMDSASKSLMDLYSYIVCQNKGDVLDIGFGMGYSAEKMYELADSYTCIEINPQIYKRALAWAKDKPNVNIIFGDWADIIPTLPSKFNGIFMDTHFDSNYYKFEEVSKQVAKEGCILAIYNYFTQRDPSTMNEYVFNLDIDKFSIRVKDHHKVNWTEFVNGQFIKTSNRIKFPEPNKVL